MLTIRKHAHSIFNWKISFTLCREWLHFKVYMYRNSKFMWTIVIHWSSIKMLMIIIYEIQDFRGIIFSSLYMSVSFRFIKIKNMHCFCNQKRYLKNLNHKTIKINHKKYFKVTTLFCMHFPGGFIGCVVPDFCCTEKFSLSVLSKHFHKHFCRGRNWDSERWLGQPYGGCIL